jgi:membrane protease YdiL (CAAX protease family)
MSQNYDKNKLQSRLWSVILPLLLYFVIYNLSIQVFLLFFRESPGYLFCILLAGLITIPFMIWAYRKANIRRSVRYSRSDLPLELLCVLGIVAFGLLYNLICTKLGLIGGSDFAKANRALTSGPLWMKILTSALVTPVLEELTFRALLAGQIDFFWGRLPAVLISSFLFGAMHFNMVQFVYAFLIGIGLALLYLWRGKLALPILAHGLTNLIVILIAG